MKTKPKPKRASKTKNIVVEPIEESIEEPVVVESEPVEEVKPKKRVITKIIL